MVLKFGKKDSEILIKKPLPLDVLSKVSFSLGYKYFGEKSMGDFYAKQNIFTWKYRAFLTFAFKVS